MDPNRSVGDLLRQALEAEGHSVSMAHPTQSRNTPERFPKADLVLINNADADRSGWDTYQRIKEQDHTTALMVYNLDQWSLSAARWIVEAADEALKSRLKTGSGHRLTGPINA
jgi:DNA-binding response OmpR family regulator